MHYYPAPEDDHDDHEAVFFSKIQTAVNKKHILRHIVMTSSSKLWLSCFEFFLRTLTFTLPLKYSVDFITNQQRYGTSRIL